MVLPIRSPLFEGHAALVRMEILKEWYFLQVSGRVKVAAAQFCHLFKVGQ